MLDYTLAFRAISLLCVLVGSLPRGAASSVAAALHKRGTLTDATVGLLDEDGWEESNVEGNDASLLQLDANKSSSGPIEVPADCNQDGAFYKKKKQLNKGLATKKVTIEGNKITTKSVPFVPCRPSTLYNYCVQHELQPSESEDKCKDREGMLGRDEEIMIKECARLGFALELRESIATEETVDALREILAATQATRVKITGYAGQKRAGRMPSENKVPAWLMLANGRAKAMEGHLNMPGIQYEEASGVLGLPSIEIEIASTGRTSVQSLISAPEKEDCVELKCAADKKRLHLEIEDFSAKSSDLRVELTMFQSQVDTCVEEEKECLAQAKVIKANAETTIEEVEKAQMLQKERFERIEKEKDEKYAILLLEEITQIKKAHTASLAALKESHLELVDAEVRKKEECVDKKLKTKVLLEKEKTAVIRLREEEEALQVRYQTCQEQQALKLDDKETIKLLITEVEKEFSACQTEVKGLEKELEVLREENEKKYEKEMARFREMEESYEEKLQKLEEETSKLSREREEMFEEISQYVTVLKKCTEDKDECEDEKKQCKEATKPCPPTPAPTPAPPSFKGVTTSTTSTTLPLPPIKKAAQVCAVGGGYIYCEECADSEDELWCRTASGKAIMEAEAKTGKTIYNHFTCMKVCNCWEVDNNAAGRSRGARGTAEVDNQRSKWTRFTYGFSKYTCGKAITQWEYKFGEQDDPNDNGARSSSLGTFEASIAQRKAWTAKYGYNGLRPTFKVKKGPGGR